MPRLDSLNFDINKVNKINQHTMNSKLTFGKYEGEIIKSVFEYDSAYIIRLYDIGAINPDSGLLKVIHQTREEIEQRAQNLEEDKEWEDIFDNNRCEGF